MCVASITNFGTKEPPHDIDKLCDALVYALNKSKNVDDWLCP